MHQCLVRFVKLHSKNRSVILPEQFYIECIRSAVIVAHFLTDDEKITEGRLIGVAVGVAVGFAGVIIMIGPEALKNFGVNTLVHLAILCAAISAGMGLIGLGLALIHKRVLGFLRRRLTAKPARAPFASRQLLDRDN